jgi:glycosyltransferase involved in cell wall biosynthesis
MQISVIITAYNNEKTIRDCVDSFINQSLPKENYEIILVSDGSTDQTVSIAQGYPRVQTVLQSNQGVAAARNNGAAHSNFGVLLFTQADIIAEPNLLARHYEFHQKNPDTTAAMVGYTTWDKTLNITPFMRWLEQGGPQFNFSRAEPDGKTDFLNFYTTNVSLKKSLFSHSGGFDQEFKVRGGVTAYEDTELAFRLQERGMQLYLDRQAVAYHRHAKDLNSVIQRRYYEGQMAHKLFNKHPGLKWDRDTSDKELFWTTIWVLNPIIMWPLKILAAMLQNQTSIPWLYKTVCRAYYNWGYLHGYIK